MEVKACVCIESENVPEPSRPRELNRATSPISGTLDLSVLWAPGVGGASADRHRRHLTPSRSHGATRRCPLGVRSGGHGIGGRSSNDGGFVIGVGALNEMYMLDEAYRLVPVGLVARWKQLGGPATAPKRR